VTILESKAKSIWSMRKSRSHWIAKNNPMASPSGTEHFGEKWRVLARTKVPSVSRTHIPIPVLFRDSEKEASMLHFILPGRGRCHAVVDEDDEANTWWILVPPWGGALVGDVSFVSKLAELQSSIRWKALSTT
jgi:hypothetical protein